MGQGRRGDDEFVEFAQANSARLQRAAYLLTGDRHQAEEAAQAALVRVYASWGRVRRKDPYAYARTVLANLLTDQWRRPVREYATEELPERPVARDVADEVTRRRWLIGALKALSPRERTVVVMRHFFDITEMDVARELNLSLGTVKSLNSRGLAKLRISIPTPRQGLETGAAR
ncbi:SigE family RNA polymerase sigma factor [Couchioplanes caeruleus]|uniref:RNA polymerase subunit sigma-70 n=1 Tax=Couchioplanes caeruleus subsp. caeruleus TaxID=56427 RepID=A0A1K0FH50_9ACTN|nr:SigE family RNA polymerase sigma factor [Couchioplanes caeruleus]OJF12169.1 RNA polymerase subunit sigma-70 [Couchioplanes caeruleus subsp. caeruleus]